MMSMLLILLPTLASARGPTGLALPVVGGGLAGPAEVGTLGLAFNPAAAHGGQPEIALDLGMLHSDLTYTLDGASPIQQGSNDVVPYFAAALPMGKFGLGVSAQVPHARSGGGEPDGDQRFHSIDGSIQVLEAALSGAWSPHSSLTLGAAARFANIRLNSERAIDTGSMLADLTDLPAEELVGDPFLEGRQRIDGATANAIGSTLGIRFEATRNLTLLAYYRSGLTATATGALVFVPSNDLDVAIEGTSHTALQLPPEVGLATAIELSSLTLIPELGWTGWSTWDSLDITTEGLTVDSPNTLLSGVLESTGISQAEFLDSIGTVPISNGTGDVFWGGLGAVLSLSSRWEMRGGIWYSPNSVPDASLHPANLDFKSIDLRLATRWTIRENTDLGLSADFFSSEMRTVDSSKLSLTNPSSSGENLPSGNGDYFLALSRLGLTLVYRFDSGTKTRAD